MEVDYPRWYPSRDAADMEYARQLRDEAAAPLGWWRRSNVLKPSHDETPDGLIKASDAVMAASW